MRAATIINGTLEVREHPDPTPGPGEILVRIHAAGLNNADLAQRAGGYPAPPGSPADIPGLEMAGEVIAIGPNAFRYKVGDRVMSLLGGGGQAEMTVVHERVAMPVPENLSWAEAGGFAEIFITAHDALFTQCGLQTGERLLVTGAAGGVGVAAVQLGVTCGARVTASVRNADRRNEVAELGALAISPEEHLTHGPYDVILEMFPSTGVPGDLNSLDIGGRVSIIAMAGGHLAELNIAKLMTKRLRIHGSTLRTRPLELKADASRLVEQQVLPHLASGRVRVPVFARYPLSDVNDAYARFEAGGKLGKIVLET